MRIRTAAIHARLLVSCGARGSRRQPVLGRGSGQALLGARDRRLADNGTIDKQYKAACYQQALKHVPEDLRDYSNITDAISAALSASLRGDFGNGNGSSERRLEPRERQPEGRQAQNPPGGASPVVLHEGVSANSVRPRRAPSRSRLLVLAALGALLLSAPAA